jgi:hypothetical protein
LKDYGATNVTPKQKDRPLPLVVKEAPFLKHVHVKERTKILVIDLDET